MYMYTYTPYMHLHQFHGLPLEAETDVNDGASTGGDKGIAQAELGEEKV